MIGSCIIPKPKEKKTEEKSELKEKEKREKKRRKKKEKKEEKKSKLLVLVYTLTSGAMNSGVPQKVLVVEPNHMPSLQRP